MKYTIALIVVVLAIGTYGRPETPTKKFPKKFDNKVHTTEKKKPATPEKVSESSYESYNETGETDAMRLPPISFPQNIPDLTRTNPGFIFSIPGAVPDATMNAPAIDSYSNPAGEAMEGLNAPSATGNAEEVSKSYIDFIAGEGELPMTVPEASSYLSGTGKQMEELMQAPSANSKTQVKPESSYSSDYSESSYTHYEQPPKGEGEKLKPPPPAV